MHVNVILSRCGRPTDTLIYIYYSSVKQVGQQCSLRAHNLCHIVKLCSKLAAGGDNPYREVFVDVV